MFKFVIFAALLAFAAAEPGLIGTPVVSSYSALPAAYGYAAAPAHHLAYSAPAYGYAAAPAPLAYNAYSPYVAAPLPYAARSIHY